MVLQLKCRAWIVLGSLVVCDGQKSSSDELFTSPFASKPVFKASASVRGALSTMDLPELRIIPAASESTGSDRYAERTYSRSADMLKMHRICDLVGSTILLRIFKGRLGRSDLGKYHTRMNQPGSLSSSGSGFDMKTSPGVVTLFPRSPHSYA
ncbi:hypothetical protein E1B28_010865 [Marasmius oreades]|uniref:Secreted protein n=1 Tax=Marasmius oreades TaxID=181124 RepID=A0A9P7RSY3_9AGAR|nr:uncharacterized protein E1B28_010865 [Marasmius oreades]KAG7089159.1 hypothetical protein E1B28_010865 [Marasmius oreades]